MADNNQKTPQQQSLNAFAKSKALEQIIQTGRSLPCIVSAITGSIVTVTFQIQSAPGQTPVTIPSVTIPIIGSEYIRLPIQVGCTGMTVAADAYLGGMSGLGGGTATLGQQANLSALAFVPLGAMSFSAQDGNVVVIYGPHGVTLADSSFASTIKLTPTSITLTAGGKTVLINSTGITLDGLLWDTHGHPYLPGSGTTFINTGPPEG